jgi:hypothetical protein
MKEKKSSGWRASSGLNAVRSPAVQPPSVTRECSIASSNARSVCFPGIALSSLRVPYSILPPSMKLIP